MKKLKVIPQSLTAETSTECIRPAISSVPQWYKDMRHTLPGQDKVTLASSGQGPLATMKWCQPVLDSFSSGYVLTLPADIEVSLNASGYPDFKWRVGSDLISGHPLQQTNGVPISGNYHEQAYKFLNEVVLETPPGYSLLFTHPLNRFDLPFQLLSGVVDTDLHPTAINFPFYLQKDFEGIIEKGTPIVQIIPIKREDWSQEVSSFNKKDSIVRYTKFASTMYRSYKKNFWVKKNYS